MTEQPYLEFDAIGKSFPGVRALSDVSFGVREGSVRALIGENGAGKSTLLKILSGAYTPTTGKLRVGGADHVFRSTSEALSAGISVIYQELQLVPEMSVAENLYLGHMPATFGVISRRRMGELAARQLDRVGESINPWTKVGRLPIAQRQMVEIAKALTLGAKIIAFDEPTSSLSEREVRRLFSVISELKAAGHVILYVSHRMEEIFEICDSVTVFRDGQHVATFDSMEGVTHDVLVQKMVGRDIQDIYSYAPRPHGTAALEVEGLRGPGLTRPVSFSVARGEILGVFGLVGAGRSEMLNMIFGAVPTSNGVTRVEGVGVSIRTPADAIRAGVMLCPEDRKKEGIIPIRSVLENLNLSARRSHSFLGLVIDEAWEKRNASTLVKRLNVRTPSLKQLMMNLSGGNQQKVILARWLSEDVKVLLLDEPTRGIDVGAKSEMYRIIYELAGQGIGVVVVSSDLPEVLGISDRIMVMRGGSVAAILSREEANQEKVLKLALPTAEATTEGEVVATA